ncbi:s-methyl-5-thioribose-1-phosphate isomerase [Brevibacterium album]|uniref:s-methyl-5-thioribose-1-phosphate isomerase n=1 Tax=Brevibacterium album TaxID=417948 RepID=UPI000685AA47|nr:s-methyl-5-thioribose-1-phosphate isomerase [Brevibacterium album]
MSTDVPTPSLIRDSVLVEPDSVRILDRRSFPFTRAWVTCRTVEDVAVAIEQMVTQSSGPLFAAAGGMVLAARAADSSGPSADRREALAAAAARLRATRPTNNGIREAVTAVLQAAEAPLGSGEALTPAVETAARAVGDRYLQRSRLLGAHAAELLRDGDTVLTHCWGESYVTETVAAAMRAGKRLSMICTETRPYLQGARLTAESLAEMGAEVSVVTDGMPAHLMSRGDISAMITAADRVTMDGHVVNKIGTLQLAIAAHAFDVPYIALVQAPDEQAPDAASVPLEDRDGSEVLHLGGQRTASERVSGIYPAFDVTPPRYIRAIATDRGRFAPNDLASYHSAAQPDLAAGTAPTQDAGVRSWM